MNKNTLLSVCVCVCVCVFIENALNCFLNIDVSLICHRIPRCKIDVIRVTCNYIHFSRTDSTKSSYDERGIILDDCSAITIIEACSASNFFAKFGKPTFVCVCATMFFSRKEWIRTYLRPTMKSKIAPAQ